MESWHEKHEMLEGKHKGKGVYAVEKTFETDGVYHIIAHTNAREMHVMPEVKVAVGNAKVEDAKKKIVIMVQGMAIIKAIQ